MSQPAVSQLAFDFEAVFEVDDYMYFYSEMLTDEVTEKQVDFLERELELAQGMQILDLACGFGRHANRLAGRGYTVSGVDFMPGFLELARRDAAARGVAVDYSQADMRQIDFQAEFDRVLLLFTAFGYFEDDENLQVLRNIARALRPAGLLIFDINNRDFMMKNYMPYYVMEKAGNLMIDRNSIDVLSGRIINQRIVIRDGIRRDKPFSIRLYNATEIRSLLLQGGFEVEKIYGGWDAQPLSTESRRLVIIARHLANSAR